MRISGDLPVRIGVLFALVGTAATASAQSLCGTYPPGGSSHGSAVILTCDTTLQGGAFTFSSTVDGAFGLTILNATDVAFNGAVGGATALSSLATTSSTFAANALTIGAGGLSVDAASGIAQGGSFKVAGASNFNGHDNPILLTDAGNDFAGPVSAAGGSVVIADQNDLAVAAVAVGNSGDLSLTAGGALTLPNAGIDVGSGNLAVAANGAALTTSGSLSGGHLILSGRDGVTLTNDVTANAGLLLGSVNGNITQIGESVTVGGTTTVDAGAGAITLTSAANDFAGALSLTGGNTQIVDANALLLGTLATGALTVNSVGALNLGSGAVGGALQASSHGGAIGQTGALSVAGASTIDADGGSITLANAGNDFVGAVRLTGANAQIVDANALTLGSSHIGNLVVTASGGITLAGDVTATGTQTYNNAVSLSGNVLLSATAVDATHGLSAGSAAVLSVNGDVAIGGDLSFAFSSTPGLGQSVTVVSATGALSGTFSSANASGLAPGHFVTATYTPTGVALTVQTSQTIGFTSPAPTDAVYAGPPYTVTAAATSGLPVALALDPASTGCALTGATVTFTGVGTCVIDANQSGDAGYTPAPQAQQSFPVGQASQAIGNFVAVPAHPTYAPGGTFSVSATGGLSGNPVTFASTTPATCTTSGSTVAMYGAGACTLTADQAGDANYAAAPQATLQVDIAQASQTLDFPPQTPDHHGFDAGATFAIDPPATSAEPNSGKPIAYSSLTESVCAVSGTTVTMLGAGICTLAADQAGDADYAAAAQATQDVLVAVAPVAAAQSVNVSFNTARGVALGGEDPNPGGPFALTYAIVAAPVHGSIAAFDAEAGTLTYTPDNDYVGTDSLTFTVETVNGLSLPATVTLEVSAPGLALSIDDGREFARYGQVVDYTVTAVNTGDVANAVPVVFTLSSGFDGDYAQLTCFEGGAGASCAQDVADPLRFTVTLQPDRSVTWRISAPVRGDTDEPSVEFGVSAIGVTPASDTATLVVFRDGFDVPYGDGSRSVPVIEGAQARAILEGEAMHEFALPAPSSATTTLLVVRDGMRELRVESSGAAGAGLVRLLERAANGRERATAWSRAQAGAVLTLGSVAGTDEPIDADGQASSRAVVLIGAQMPLTLP